jgi:hypothetical protein
MGSYDALRNVMNVLRPWRLWASVTAGEVSHHREGIAATPLPVPYFMGPDRYKASLRFADSLCLTFNIRFFMSLLTSPVCFFACDMKQYN